jgi:hypothetical protein
MLILVSNLVIAQSDDDIYADIGDVELKADAGFFAPDDFLYFIDGLLEDILVGDDPEKALMYKEEKISEAKQMIEKGNVEAAKKAFTRVNKYSEILQKEVSPELEKRTRESSKAVKEVFDDLEDDIKGEEWDDVRELVEEHGKTEDRIALAAKVSTQIQELCTTLSELDPVEYSRICRTENDAPKWKRELDEELTEDQRNEAKNFFGIMTSCFNNPRECPCDKIKIDSFSKKCEEIAPLAADCDEGDENACEQMEEMDDIIDLLPPHLQRAMEAVEDKFRDSEFDNHMPPECTKAGATTREACERIMFKENAPIECIQAFEDKNFDFQNEKEAREACEKIMFEENAPIECIEEGLTDHEECGKFMFQLDAPEECIEAGLTGAGRNDWEKCDLIRFQLEAPQECLDAGYNGEHRDDWKKCEAIKFELDAPQECLDAGIKGTDRRAWDECSKIQFRFNAPEECLAEGLDGSRKDDWDKCEKIKFRLEVPQECLDAGLDGSGRNDWRKCDKIKMEMDEENRRECDQCAETCGDLRWDCYDGKCECFEEETYNECDDGCDDECGHDQWECSPNGKCACYEYNECKDGCEQECGDMNSRCVGTRCECYGSDNPPQENQCDNCGEKCGNLRWECNNGACECFDDNNGGGTDPCAVMLCQDGYDCVNGECIYNGPDPVKTECEDGCTDECGDLGWECGNNGECICHQREPVVTDPCASMFCPDDHYCDNGECIYNGPEPSQDECDKCGELCGDAAWDCSTGSCVCET